jgi:hypothetical protein
MSRIASQQQHFIVLIKSPQPALGPCVHPAQSTTVVSYLFVENRKCPHVVMALPWYMLPALILIFLGCALGALKPFPALLPVLSTKL